MADPGTAGGSRMKGIGLWLLALPIPVLIILWLLDVI